MVDTVTTITKALEAYADRGVFRSFSEKRKTDEKCEFRFSWLKDKPFLLIYNQRSNNLLFKSVLPAVEKKSFVDSRFRVFLQSRYAKQLPEHRRIDKNKLKLSCINSDHFGCLSRVEDWEIE